MNILRLAFLVWAMHAFTPLFATTIVPFAHLGEATFQSGAVVLAVAMYPVETLDNNMTYKDMAFRVTAVVKGPLEMGQEFLLRPFSKHNETFAIDVAGDFDPAAGKTYLLFLSPQGTVWRSPMLNYYVFEELKINGQSYLVPFSGAGIEIMPHPDGVVPEPLAIYLAGELLPTLQVFASGTATAWSTTALRTFQLPDNTLSERALADYCDFKLGSSVALARWQNPAANVYFDDTGLPAGFSATLTSILATMKASYTGIQPMNAGQTSFVPNCVGGTAAGLTSNFLAFCNSSLGGSQAILVMFDDPCNEIAPLSGCSGVLGMGGSYSFTPTHTYKGDVWQNAGYGYLIINDGVPACFSGTPFARFFTHELTHAYRMDHISTTAPGAPGQNMNPSCCNAINTLDMDCMNYTYDIALPVELTSFTVQRKSEKAALLRWATATENNNAYFSLEHATDGIFFSPLARVEAANDHSGGQYKWLDTHVLPGLNYYRLSQTDRDGRLTNLGLRSLRFNLPATLRIVPSPISRENAGAVEINCSELLEGVLDIISPDGRIVHSQTLLLEAGQHQIPLSSSLAAGIYRAVLRSGQQLESFGFSKL